MKLKLRYDLRSKGWIQIPDKISNLLDTVDNLDIKKIEVNYNYNEEKHSLVSFNLDTAINFDKNNSNFTVGYRLRRFIDVLDIPISEFYSPFNIYKTIHISIHSTDNRFSLYDISSQTALQTNLALSADLEVKKIVYEKYSRSLIVAYNNETDSVIQFKLIDNGENSSKLEFLNNRINTVSLAKDNDLLIIGFEKAPFLKIINLNTLNEIIVPEINSIENTGITSLSIDNNLLAFSTHGVDNGFQLLDLTTFQLIPLEIELSNNTVTSLQLLGNRIALGYDSGQSFRIINLENNSITPTVFPTFNENEWKISQITESPDSKYLILLVNSELSSKLFIYNILNDYFEKVIDLNKFHINENNSEFKIDTNNMYLSFPNNTIIELYTWKFIPSLRIPDNQGHSICLEIISSYEYESKPQFTTNNIPLEATFVEVL